MCSKMISHGLWPVLEGRLLIPVELLYLFPSLKNNFKLYVAFWTLFSLCFCYFFVQSVSPLESSRTMKCLAQTVLSTVVIKIRFPAFLQNSCL